ncbi:hypothetical protein DOTSEDRAFT_75678 [Dothistroma septosporum NZE10]|uniref:Ricin B lectin domain-containing protein n=1 Tax=Dothistroma septosporum (strain NZE10 / CBS 128990) TaxID=675120 RepID=M2YJH1_DOTSN|nr:hypothetical protein DOTSEDRAFT_75678 [Dothistroma septosporum NZE10]
MPHDRIQPLDILLQRGHASKPAALPGLITSFTAQRRGLRDFSLTSATFSLEETLSNRPSMSKESSYFLVPASGGLCIQPQNNSVYTANVEGKEAQQWVVEKGEGDRIAFRNAAGKQYLRAKGGHNSAQVVLGARQWWKLEGSKTPSAFWIKNEDFPKAYLCNSYGRITPKNLIYMWAPEPYWTQTMLWYVRDVESWKTNNGSSPEFALTGGSLEAASARTLQAKETELLQWQQRTEARQKSQDTMEESLKEQIKDRQQQLDAQAKDLEEKEKALQKREGDLLEREGQSQKDSKSASKVAEGNSEDHDTRLSQLRQQLATLQAALRESQTKEREATEREQVVGEENKKLRQSKPGPAAAMKSPTFDTQIDDTVTAHRLRPLFDRSNDNRSGAMRDSNMTAAHGLQPLFERTNPKPTVALRDNNIAAHRLQSFFERPACGHCRMSHVVGES